ncbi:hypothetical protein QL886_05710 [Psychrobacter sp. APC 3281]|uniref:hypothetical protein n=1 Tax=Psychrobacter sp. APC 3281 TaxID=3035190 RepID=UPI0025B3E7EA|nr:hypothetical protein [Psychrobacter sp. APC 3281]MDN3447131.1 hypothetical protein [Psychrobacter sp. APC 3281]
MFIEILLALVAVIIILPLLFGFGFGLIVFKFIGSFVLRQIERFSPKNKSEVEIWQATTYFTIAFILAVSSSITSNYVSKHDAYIAVTFALILASIQAFLKMLDVVFDAMKNEVG